jgi:hypothetical protein
MSPSAELPEQLDGAFDDAARDDSVHAVTTVTARAKVSAADVAHLAATADLSARVFDIVCR